MSDHLCFHRSPCFSPPPLSLVLSLSRFNTHRRTLVHLGRLSLPYERRVSAVSANKRQSPPFSPATSHHSSPRCDRLARWLSLSLSLSARPVPRPPPKKKKRIHQQPFVPSVLEKRRFAVRCLNKQWKRNVAAVFRRYEAAPILKLHFAKWNKSPWRHLKTKRAKRRGDDLRFLIDSEGNSSDGDDIKSSVWNSDEPNWSTGDRETLRRGKIQKEIHHNSALERGGWEL